MSYELRSNQSLQKNLRRIFRQQIDGALALLRGEKEPQDTLVHDVRKHLKKARAALRLVRNEIGSDLFRFENHHLREAGRIMTETRDAEVRLQTMRRLEDATHHHYRSYKKIEQLLALELESFQVAFGDSEKAAIPMLERAREEAAKWHLKSFGRKQIRRELQHSYRCARRALGSAKTQPSAAQFHQLRKRVKLLGYQLRVIRPLNHIVLGTVIRELIELGHLLGRVHDLIFLADRLRLLRTESHWGKQDEKLLAMIARSNADLQRDGIQIAERFFAERSSKFGTHINEWFEAQTEPDSLTESLLVLA